MTGVTASRAVSLFIGAIIFSCSFSVGFGQGTRWSQQDSTGGSYLAAAALDTLHCIAAGSAAGEGIVRRTTDGGATWRTVLTAGRSLTTVSWPTPDLCLAAGTKDTVWRSIDGGGEWSPVLFPFGGINKISMYDSLRGMGIRVGHGVVHTTDGGITWSVVGGADGIFGEDIAMMSLAAAGVLSEKFYHVDAGGDILPTGLPLRLDRLAFTDSLNGWSAAEGQGVFGEVGYIVLLHTTDGGRSWDTGLSMRSSSPLTSLAFAGREHGLAGGTRRVLQTTDGGNIWMDDPSPIFQGKGDIREIAYPAPGVAWAVTKGGYILRGALDRPAGVEREGASAGGEQLDVWPNPSSGDLTISYAVASRRGGRLSIVDLLGRDVVPIADLVPAPQGGRLVLVTSDLPAGCYFVRLWTEGGTIVRPVTIVR